MKCFHKIDENVCFLWKPEIVFFECRIHDCNYKLKIYECIRNKTNLVFNFKKIFSFDSSIRNSESFLIN